MVVCGGVVVCGGCCVGSFAFVWSQKIPACVYSSYIPLSPLCRAFHHEQIHSLIASIAARSTLATSRLSLSPYSTAMSQTLSPSSAAYGALLGAAVGDSCGSLLEFSYGTDARAVEHALTTPGGGSWNSTPGQLTDDTELALCLEAATPITGGTAAAAAPHAGLPASNIARWYGRWISTSPADSLVSCLAASTDTARILLCCVN